MERKTKVTIIILSYNGKKDTLECLASLKNLAENKVQTKIILVDNGSSDGSVNSVRKSFPNVQIIENKKNLGFSEGNNVGIRKAVEAGADFIFLLNNDTIVDQALVEELAQAAKHSNADIISPKIYFAPGFEFHKDRYTKQEQGRVIWYAGGLIDWKNILTSHRGVDAIDQGQFDELGETDFVTGCAMFVKAQVFQKIGLLDPVYFAYFEDADFSLRARKQGVKVIYVPNAILWHKNAASFGGSGSSFQDYFVTRNRLIFGMRYAPIRSRIALLREAFAFTLKGPQRKRQAVIDALLRRIPDLKSLES